MTFLDAYAAMALPENDRSSLTWLLAGDSALCKKPEMVTYLISYDLHKPSKNNDELIQALHTKGARRVLTSSWSLTTMSSAEQVRSWIMQFLCEKDRIIICAVGEYANYNPIVEIRSASVERNG